jgi:5-methylcytosine-specific restriction protein A
MLPEISYFGARKQAISIVVGGIYLAACIKYGKDKGVWLLIDSELDKIDGVEYSVVKSSKIPESQLYWLHIAEITHLRNILDNNNVWSSYKIASYEILERCNKSQNAIKDINKRRLDSFYIDSNIGQNLEDIAVAEEVIENTYIGGAVKQIIINAYERDIKARNQCLKYYGNYVCQICGFDFEKVYGNLGKGFIHVHHIKPIASIKQEYQINPLRDLIPVCPNCHAMLHRTKEGVSIDEIKKILEIKT